jgi:hypothetical protein
MVVLAIVLLRSKHRELIRTHSQTRWKYLAGFSLLVTRVSIQKNSGCCVNRKTQLA